MVAAEDRDSNIQRKPIHMADRVNEEEMIAMNDTVQCKFTFGTLNAIACGACSEYCISGMSRAKFSTDNKLLTNEMMYDVMGFLEQLLAASVRTVAFEAGASCLESALVVASEEARIITLAKAPFSIISANLVWTRLTRHTQVK